MVDPQGFKRGALQLLEQAKAILADPMSWTKSYNARDAVGEDVADHSTAARSFCLIGAVQRARYDLHFPMAFGNASYDQAKAMLTVVVENKTDLQYVNPCNYNDADQTNHRDVLEVLDRAVTELRNQLRVA